MNIHEKIEKTRQKIQKAKNIMEGIHSQIKYLEYIEEVTKLQNDIRKLENIRAKEEANTKKIWIDVGDGWKERKYKQD